MKRKHKFIWLLLACGLFVAGMASAQTIQKDANGNYKTVSAPKAKSEDGITSNTFTSKDGTVYPIHHGAKGGLYYLKPNKAGEMKKYYLPKN